ncbi:MAG: DUF5048 domain-containing protein [Roseburia sp.]|nr:DUF5048 domain-containing protein [Roseburia sp.]
MKYNITQYDKDLLKQESVDYRYRLFIVGKDRNVLDTLYGIQSIGTYNIDSESDARRTVSFTLYLDECYRNASLESRLADWIGCDFELQIGIYSNRDGDYVWYPCGYYLITDANTTYNSLDNSLVCTLSDWYSKFNGARNGQIGGAPTISIPNEDENGQPVTIKQTTEGILKSEAKIENYIVDDIGQFYGMPQNNPDYEQYRNNYPAWNQQPYDLEYQAGCTVSDILEEIRSFYPNCEMYFDVYGNFCFQLIPSCDHDPVLLDDHFLQSILVADSSEQVQYDIANIKNITEIFGADYDVDRFSSLCSTSSDTYAVSLEDYTSYSSGDIIAFVPDTANKGSMKISVNSLPAIPLYREYTTIYVDEGTLSPNKTYVFQVKKVDGEYVAYFLGQYQPHALCVLTNDAGDSKYSKSYFAEKYNCDERNITLRVEPDSPFSVQRLGEIPDVKSGDEFENIISDSVAVENSIYYNRISSSVHDVVTIATKMIPFLDVNVKVEYQKQQEDNPSQYIIKSVSNNTDSFTSNITMYRFYPLYYV